MFVDTSIDLVHIHGCGDCMLAVVYTRVGTVLSGCMYM